MQKLIVFDVNETLLDLSALDQEFERVFGNASVRGEWFAQVLQNSLVATVTGKYGDFGRIAGYAIDMTAQRFCSAKVCDRAERQAVGLYKLGGPAVGAREVPTK